MLLYRNIRGVWIVRYHGVTHYTGTYDIVEAITHVLKVTKH